MRIGNDAWLVGIPALVMMVLHPAAIQEEADSDAAVNQGYETVAEVVIGHCDGSEQHEPLVELAPFATRSGERLGSERAIPAVASISRTIPLSLEQLEAPTHAIVVRATDGQDEALLACGELAGELTAGGELIVGLGEENGSGVTGIAHLSPDQADRSLMTASVFLAENVFRASVNEQEQDALTDDPARGTPANQPVDHDQSVLATPSGDQTENAQAAGGEEDSQVASGPLAYWRLDETSGPTAADATGDGFDGIYGSRVALDIDGAVPASNNPAAGFDGHGEAYVDMGDVLDFAGRTPFSLEAWVAPSRLNAGAYPRLVQKEGTDSSGLRQGYLLFVSGDTVQVGFERWRDGAKEAIVSTGPIPTGEPTHVVVVYDGETMSLFINGMKAAWAPSKQSLLDTTFPFRIGNSSDGANPFEGTIDEVAVYDTALDKQTVVARYRAGVDLQRSPQGTPEASPGP
jgi:Concanavalin A-like lectin/glucanases superfamily